MAHGPTIGGPVTSGRRTAVVEPPSPPPDVYRLPDTPPPAPPVYYVLMPDYQRPTSTTREASVDTSDTPESRVIQVGYGWQKVTPPIAAAKYDTFKIHIVYDLGYGEIDSVSKVFHGTDEIYPTARVGFTVQVKLGTAAQTAFSPAFPDTGFDSTLPGRALVYVIFDPLSADMTGGNPDITIIYKGKKCYDWRDSTWKWTENPFLIVYDMLTNTEYGARVSTAELVTATWTACANRCDEVVDGEARWRAAYMLTDRQGVIDLARDLLQTTCAGGLYYADGGWTAYLDEQHVIGCRPSTGTTPVGTTDRAQSFIAPGVRIKPVLKLDLAGGFTTPTLRLRSTLAGADLATYTPSGLVAGTGQEVTFDLSSVHLTVGATYYLVLLATTGVTWHQAATDLYSGGSSWNNVPGWTQEATKDFYFQVHYADHELVDQLAAVAGQIPLMAVSKDDVIQFSRSKVSAPRAVSVSCYDVADWVVKPIRFESADVQSGAVQPDELRVQMAACAGPKQTYRLCRQYQRLAARSLTTTAAVPMHGVAIALGDVAWMTCSTGPLVAKWFRVHGVTQGFGTFSLALQEYDWTDYSREETVTLDTAVIPSASSKQKFQKVSDDFTGGGTTNATIGERLWSMTSGTTISYRGEANHAGIVVVGSNGSGGTIALDNAGSKFAPKSCWRQKWIFMLHGTLAGTYDLLITGVFNWRFWRDATEIFSLIVDGTDTGINFASGTWIEIDAWCDGGGTAYWIATQGATVASGSAAVSDTGFSALLRTGTEGTNLSYGSIDVDYAEVAFPTAR